MGYFKDSIFNDTKKMKQEDIKLHLGCGRKYIEGFTHIDIVDYPHIDLVTTIDDLCDFTDNTVTLIYACHVLEHFKRKKYKTALSEWYRVLKPEGILRISVPGFEELIKIYQKRKNLDEIIGPIMGGQKILYDYHYMLFDFPTLNKSLKEVGFREVRKYNWKETEHAHIDDYSQAYIPHMDKENGLPISLNIEAIK